MANLKRPNSANMTTETEVPKARLEDIGGLEGVKNELKKRIDAMKHPDKESEVSPSKGVLLYGPMGCGKTLLAEAIGNDFEGSFISVRGWHTLLPDRLGKSQENLRDIFTKAKTASFSILFLDNIDNIGKALLLKNGKPSVALAGQFFTELDSLERKDNVFVICATTRLEYVIHYDILRFDRLTELYVPMPDEESRMAIFKSITCKYPMKLQLQDVDFENLAKITAGFSGADLKAICQRAGMIAVRQSIENNKIRRKNEDAQNPAANAEDDPDPEITKATFEEAMQYARRSVPDQDIHRCESFDQKLKQFREVGAPIPTTGYSSDEEEDDDFDLYS